MLNAQWLSNKFQFSTIARSFWCKLLMTSVYNRNGGHVLVGLFSCKRHCNNIKFQIKFNKQQRA